MLVAGHPRPALPRHARPRGPLRSVPLPLPDRGRLVDGHERPRRTPRCRTSSSRSSTPARHLRAVHQPRRAAADTLRRIEHTIRGDLGWWLRQDRYDALLFSAGGNDLIDAARDPATQAKACPPRHGGPAAAGRRHGLRDAGRAGGARPPLPRPNCNTVHDAPPREPRTPSHPLFLNCTTTPPRPATHRRGRASGRGFFEALHEARTASIPGLWPDLTRGPVHHRGTIEEPGPRAASACTPFPPRAC